jgi:hypothetical protein
MFRQILLILLFAVCATLVQGQQTVLPFGSTWKYFDQGDLNAADWMQSTFSDIAWPQGAAELGYGDGDENTVLSYGSDPAN